MPGGREGGATATVSPAAAACGANTPTRPCAVPPNVALVSCLLGLLALPVLLLGLALAALGDAVAARLRGAPPAPAPAPAPPTDADPPAAAAP